jgi:putative spermidine/putrescine transport system permease protein
LMVLTIIVSLFLLLPIALSVMAGLVNNYPAGLRSGLATRWLVQVWELYADTIWRSLLIAFACMLTTIALGVPCAYALAQTRSRWAMALEELLTLPVAVPGLATALALILAYGEMRWFRQSTVFILVGHVLFTLPFMVRVVHAAFMSAELRSLEEAARTLGAGFVRRSTSVLIPSVLPAVAAGCLMVFTLSIGEFNLTWMLHTPLTRTLPVGLADSYASMRIEVGSAYTLIFMLLVTPLLVLMQWLAAALERKLSSAQ